MGRGKFKRSDIETNFSVRTLDASISPEEYRELPKHPLFIILDNLRSAFNVGAIFRTCDALRVSGLYLCGYTACPPHDKLTKTSLGTIDFVPWKKFDSAADAIRSLHEQNIQVWAAETTSHSTPFTEATYPSPLGIVFGNEALGVGKEALDMCDGLVEIPVFGFKNSINVATSCGIIGFKAIESMRINQIQSLKSKL
jgi:23S rRNA (guanosine2251-2'-O)-methyltransferase